VTDSGQALKSRGHPKGQFTSAARTAAPWLCDLEQAGQGRAPQPNTAHVTSLQEMQGQ
jgi:hypothetical protein